MCLQLLNPSNTHGQFLSESIAGLHSVFFLDWLWEANAKELSLLYYFPHNCWEDRLIHPFP